VSRTCTVCGHPDRPEIDKDLVNGTALRDIAGRFSISKSALERHKADHIPHSLLKAQEVQDVARGDRLASELIELKDDVHRMKSKAEKAGDLKTALVAVDKALRALELQARLAQIIDDRPQVNVLIDARVQQAIVDALEPFDAAKYAVSRALKELEYERAQAS
jgi:hypothetical protein